MKSIKFLILVPAQQNHTQFNIILKQIGIGVFILILISIKPHVIIYWSFLSTAIFVNLCFVCLLKSECGKMSSMNEQRCAVKF